MNLPVENNQNRNSYQAHEAEILRKSVDAFKKKPSISVEDIDNSKDLSQEMEKNFDETLTKENIFISNEYGIKLIAAENFQSFLTLLHVGNSIVIYEITSDANSDDMEQDIVLQLYISTFSCIFLI